MDSSTARERLAPPAPPIACTVLERSAPVSIARREGASIVARNEYAPLPVIVGLLSGFIGDAGDVFTALLPEARRITDFQPAVLDAPSGGPIVVELRTATGGGGLVTQATIPDGAFVPTAPATNLPLDVSAGTTLYLRIISISGTPMNLQGVFLMAETTSSEVTQNLTTVSKVFEYDATLSGIAVGTIQDVIDGVSESMANWLARQLNQATLTEFHDSPGYGEIVLDNWPVDLTGSVVEENNDVVPTGDYEIRRSRELVKLASGGRIDWDVGEIKATYLGGYAVVPSDLCHLATKQCVAELLRVQGHTIGTSQVERESGPQETFDEDGFLPSVTQGLKSYRRLV